MNKSLILVASTCLVAIVVVQVSAMNFGAMTPGFGMTRGINQDAYYRRYQAYNDAQQLRVLQKTVNDLSFSSTLSLVGLLVFSFLATNTTGNLAG